MPRATVYTSLYCPYCDRAKRLLTEKLVDFDEIDVTRQSGLREELRIRSGGRTTVPQIWVGNTHVGGCDDLYDLERRGKLDALLASSADHGES